LDATTSPSAEARPAVPPTDEPPVHVDPRARLEILGAILLGLFLSALDQTVVGTALPRIITDLGGNELYTWAVAIYLLTATITGPIYGKLSDLFGRKPLFMIGISLFLLGSFLSGLSQEMWQLIAFRGLQGLGAGAIFPIALATIGDLFSPAERGKYQGLFGAVVGLSALIGPAIGGFLTDNLRWHWVFFVNLPLGAIVLFIIWRTLPTVARGGPRPSIDYLGVAVFTAALVPILLGLTNKQSGEWTDLTVGGFIVGGLLLFALFLWIESRAAEPIVPPNLFRNRVFAVSVFAMFLTAFAFFATVLFLPRWFQVVGGASATESGYQILPLLVGLIASAITAGQVVSRTGRYKLIIVAGLVIMTIGLILLTNVRADTPLPVLWTWMFITGVGIGPSLAVFTIAVQNAVPVERLGVATSNLTFFQQVGGTVGLSIAGTVFGSTFLNEIPGQLAKSGVPQPLIDQFQSQTGSNALNQLTGVGDLGARILAQVPEQFRATVEPFVPQIVAGIYQAFSIATASTFVLGIVTSVTAAVLVFLFMPELPMRQTVGVPARVPRPADAERTDAVGAAGP
jgi:EmrB/QacA subfamily drug resistance transporter